MKEPDPEAHNGTERLPPICDPERYVKLHIGFVVPR